MSRTTLTLIVVIGILAALSSWLSREKAVDPFSVARALPHVPDYYIAGFNASSYSAEGQPRHRLSAERMTHYADDRSTALQRPKLVFSDAGADSWLLDAGSGTLDGTSEILQLSQSVNVRHQQQGGTVELKTEQLTVETRKQRATTRTPVTITAPRARIDAAGLDANFAEQRLVLYSVRGRYEP